MVEGKFNWYDWDRSFKSGLCSQNSIQKAFMFEVVMITLNINSAFSTWL